MLPKSIPLCAAGATLLVVLTASARQRPSGGLANPLERPPQSGSTAIICHADEPGPRLLIAGQVVDRHGRPIAGAAVTVHNTDAVGLYGDVGSSTRSPRIRGTVATDDSGCFQVLTVRPAAYPGGQEPAHVHLDVSAPAYRHVYSTIWFEGDRLITPSRRHAARRRTAQNPDEVTKIEAIEQLDGGLAMVRHTIEMAEN